MDGIMDLLVDLDENPGCLKLLIKADPYDKAVVAPLTVIVMILLFKVPNVKKSYSTLGMDHFLEVVVW